jgi:hypothetical protein
MHPLNRVRCQDDTSRINLTDQIEISENFWGVVCSVWRTSYGLRRYRIMSSEVSSSLECNPPLHLHHYTEYRHVMMSKVRCRQYIDVSTCDETSTIQYIFILYRIHSVGEIRIVRLMKNAAGGGIPLAMVFNVKILRKLLNEIKSSSSLQFLLTVLSE